MTADTPAEVNPYVIIHVITGIFFYLVCVWGVYCFFLRSGQALAVGLVGCGLVFVRGWVGVGWVWVWLRVGLGFALVYTD